jgi:hypothetical protein
MGVIRRKGNFHLVEIISSFSRTAVFITRSWVPYIYGFCDWWRGTESLTVYRYRSPPYMSCSYGTELIVFNIVQIERGRFYCYLGNWVVLIGRVPSCLFDVALTSRGMPRIYIVVDLGLV